MSTQQNNAEAADGHSFADKIGQLVSAKYQALFGTTTYSKRRVMSGVVMTRYVNDGFLVGGRDNRTMFIIRYEQTLHTRRRTTRRAPLKALTAIIIEHIERGILLFYDLLF